VTVALAAATACVDEGRAQEAPRVAVVKDDTAALGRLLRSVRGVNPLLCELATRNVDMHGWWSRFGSMGGDPLQVDSSSAALIRWIQHDHNDPALVPPLRAAMRDPDACVRRVAGSFLSRVEHPSADAALLEASGDADANVRLAATLGLGLADRGGERVASALLTRLRDNAVPVRRAAAWALGALEVKEALLPLIAALERDPDPGVRQAAAWALGQLD
jgi:hypothetical protein